MSSHATPIAQVSLKVGDQNFVYRVLANAASIRRATGQVWLDARNHGHPLNYRDAAIIAQRLANLARALPQDAIPSAS